MESFLRSEEFADLHDVFMTQDGNLAILNILVPFTRSRENGDSQAGFQYLARFPKTAEYGSIYYALYMPFSRDINPDSRIKGDVQSIFRPIMEGPYELGVSGPAIFHNQPATYIADNDPEGPNDDQVIA